MNNQLMESITSRKERIRTIRSINEIIEKYQNRPLSCEDFDMLYELDQDQLIDVFNSMLDQARDMQILSGRQH